MPGWRATPRCAAGGALGTSLEQLTATYLTVLRQHIWRNTS